MPADDATDNIDHGTSLFTKDKFLLMLKAIDTDGNGTIEKAEYKVVFDKIFKGDFAKTEEEFEKVWKEIDTDGSESVDLSELAAHYGFQTDVEGDGTTNEMTDDQILRALELQSVLLEDMKQEKEAAESAATAAASAAEPAVATNYDSSIVQVSLADKKKNQGTSTTSVEDQNAMVAMLEDVQLGGKSWFGGLSLFSESSDELLANAEAETLLAYIRSGKQVRCVDEKGEMPLHKLARIKPDDTSSGSLKSKKVVKAVFMAVVKKMREEIEAVNKKKKADAGSKPFLQSTLAMDINRQDKNGKTPLFIAVEYKNLDFIDWLYGLPKKDGPDTLLVNSEGWSVLHTAVHTGDVLVLKHLSEYFTPTRLKVLLNTPNRDGREPLHLATYSAPSEEASLDIVKHLINLGANTKKLDNAGNSAAALAGKRGRRTSKELLDSTE